jgi:hypothetical protein
MTISGLGAQSIVDGIPQIVHPTSVAERWASYVLGVCKSERDPRTLGIWAQQVAVSYTTLRENCRLVGVQPRHARDFARVLRVVVKSSFDSYFGSFQLASVLDVGDRRTLESILQNAGLPHATALRQVSVVSFLDNQRFMMHDNAGLRIIYDVFALGKAPPSDALAKWGDKGNSTL